jgi:carbon-monoxide dehydrogenase large subunit
MSATETRFIGAPLKRKEDDPLLRGRGSYVDNIALPGSVALAIVRSPYAHARITKIDTAAARACEGVVAVLTGADLQDDWKAAMPCAWPVTEDMKNPPHYPLAVRGQLPGRRSRRCRG